MDYGRKHHELDRDLLGALTALVPRRSLAALATIWLELVALVILVRIALPAEYFWYAYAPVAFLVAGRFGALLQIVHEAAHGLLHPAKRTNDLISAWCAARPIGISHEGYAQGHYRHHAYTGTERDPESDREKFRVPSVRDPRLYALLLKDLSGLTALMVFLAYGRNAVDLDERRSARDGPESIARNFVPLCAVQAVVLGGLFGFDVGSYLLLWVYPAMGPHMFLMRLRGIAEHGLAGQLGITRDGVVGTVGEGTFYTRSFGTPARSYAFRPLAWLERALIGSLHVYYHHEHHLYPNVPFYHLPRLHERVAPAVGEQNPDVYVRGYLAAVLKNVLAAP